MPPTSENVVHPCVRQTSHSFDFVKRRLKTARRLIDNDGASVTDWALPCVNDRPVYGRSSGWYPNSIPSIPARQKRALVPTIPFGSPVVPDVNMICNGASGVSMRTSTVAAGAASTRGDRLDAAERRQRGRRLAAVDGEHPAHVRRVAAHRVELGQAVIGADDAGAPRVG